MKTLFILFCLAMSSGMALATVTQTKPDPDKPSRLYVAGYSLTNRLDWNGVSSDGYYSDGSVWYEAAWDQHDHYMLTWADGQGGQEQHDWVWKQYFSYDEGNTGNGYFHGIYTWPTNTWPDLSNGVLTASYYYDYTNQPPVTDAYTNSYGAPAPLVQEHCVAGGQVDLAKYSGPGYYGWVEVGGHFQYQRTADAVLKFETGGKAGSTRQNLYCFHATAEAQKMTTGEGIENLDLFNLTDLGPVDPTNISIGALGQLGSDGNLWVLLSDNTTNDVTPQVNGVDYYTFVEPMPSEYNLAITANGISLSNSVATNGANFCVGQNVPFALAGLPTDGSVIATNFQWTLDGTYVNKWIPPVGDGSDTYTNEPALLKNVALQTNWWISGGSNSVTYTASVKCDLIFTNGSPTQPVNVSGKFSMFRPKVNWTGYMPGTVAVDVGYWEIPPFNNYALHFGYTFPGDPPDHAGMTFTKTIVNGGLYSDSGYYYPIQLFGSYSSEYCGTNGLTVHFSGNGLDKQEDGLPYYRNTYYDDPGMICDDGNHHESYSASFNAYLMFNPQTGGSIGVPLKRIDWNWAGAAEAVGGGVWQKTSTNAPAISVNNVDTLAFPVWTNRLDLQLPMHGVTTNTNTICY